MQLAHYLIKHLTMPKKEIRSLCQRGLILLNEQVLSNVSVEVDGQLHRLKINQEDIPLKRHHYYMLNKAKGFVSAVKDDHLPTVSSLFNEDVWPIGRLDRNTEGLLMMTDHGQLSFRLPLLQYQVRKVYRVVVNGKLTVKECERFANGIEFHGGICCAPAKLDIIHAGDKESEAFVTLIEGKFHQVKKMFLSIGLYVTYLQRIQYGPLVLDHNLQPNGFRALTIEEIKMLWDCVQMQY